MASWGAQAAYWSPKRWGLAIEASIFLAIAAARLRFSPFRRVAEGLGVVRPASIGDLQTEFAVAPAKDVGWAVKAMARRVPWPSLCLCQALAGAWMLERRHANCRIVLGTQMDTDGEMAAHAWLWCGATITGGWEDPLSYSLVATFEVGSARGCARSSD